MQHKKAEELSPWQWPTSSSSFYLNVDVVVEKILRCKQRMGNTFKARLPMYAKILEMFKGFSGQIQVEVLMKTEESISFRIPGKKEILQLVPDCFEGPGIREFLANKASLAAAAAAEAKAKAKADKLAAKEAGIASEVVDQPVLPVNSPKTQASAATVRFVSGKPGRYGTPPRSAYSK